MHIIDSLIAEVLETNDLEVPSVIAKEMRWRDDLEMDSFALAELAVLVESKSGHNLFEGRIPSSVGELRERWDRAKN